MQVAAPQSRRRRGLGGGGQKCEAQRRAEGHQHRQGQQDADRGAKHIDPVDGPARNEMGQGQTQAGDDRRLGQQGDQKGGAHCSRSRAASSSFSSALISAGLSGSPMPSRAVAALAAEPAKKVSTIRFRAPAATVSVRGTGR